MVGSSSFRVIGKIISYWGTRGHLKVYSLTFSPDRYYKLSGVYVSSEKDRRFYNVEGVKPYKGNVWLFKLEDIDTIRDAEKVKNCYIEVPEAEKLDLPEDTYFIDDLVGLKVFSLEGKYIGTLKDIIEGTANDVYIIREGDREVLIPAVKEFVKEVDLKEKKMVIKVIEGLL